VLSINIVVLVMGIYVNKAGSLYYGNLIKMETDNWGRAPIVSMINPPNNAKCPNETETITGTFSGINARCNYIDGTYRIGLCRKREGLYSTRELPPTKFDKFDG
jgi:hypothetical protein